MDFWARLIGSTSTPKKAAPKPIAANDSQARLARFRRVYNTVLDLCNRPRNLAAEGPLLDNLHVCLERIAAFLREETRAPVPHSCIHFAASSQIYAVISRAATVSHYEPVIKSTIAVFAALVDTEEENFLSSASFAKSLIRLVSKVVDSGNVLIRVETETAILELLFTIAAKIRLEPEILPVWFQSTAKPELEDVFVREKKSFVGITQKDDFPLCYLLIDRVHHEGRIGDFARTGLLYIFEATGHSSDLEQWVVSSDLPTLMASGLGALYSQLSRELSILHPDATLPAVLAMSDYSTTHPRATAESAFSERHLSHMATFLSYLAFWQDVLDHCRSADVKQTLLDHFQILFLQQLLYPSLLQSSDTDAGSSVAVLTYMTSIVESLEYPDLIHMMLAYLLAIQDGQISMPASNTTSTPVSQMPPRSPTAVKRRQSLMLLNAPKDPEDAVEPVLFSLVDLVINNINSKSSQTVYAALKLTSTIINRQRRYAFGTLLKVQNSTTTKDIRTVGVLEVEVQRYSELAVSLHPRFDLDATYTSLCEDLRYQVESQSSGNGPSSEDKIGGEDGTVSYSLSPNDPLLRAIFSLLETFLTNSVDVNLALSQVIICIALCGEIRLEDWALIPPGAYTYAVSEHDTSSPPPTQRPWQTALDQEEQVAWSALQRACLHPIWPTDTNKAPPLYQILEALCTELHGVRATVSNFDQLLAGRKTMLQAANLDPALNDLSSIMSAPASPRGIPAPPKKVRSGHSRQSSASSIARGRTSKTTNIPSSSAASSPHHTVSAAVSPNPHARDTAPELSLSSPALRPIFQPPPPETPSTTDVLMQPFTFPPAASSSASKSTEDTASVPRKASLNHILTNIVVLQEFILEFVAVLQIRAAVLGSQEVLCSKMSEV